jgi:hypothetical protein
VDLQLLFVLCAVSVAQSTHRITSLGIVNLSCHCLSLMQTSAVVIFGYGHYGVVGVKTLVEL